MVSYTTKKGSQGKKARTLIMDQVNRTLDRVRIREGYEVNPRIC
jgi:hypothetical protein